jgi:hypothetical protein
VEAPCDAGGVPAASDEDAAMQAVGGTLVLTEAKLEFRPNRVDAATGGTATPTPQPAKL